MTDEIAFAIWRRFFDMLRFDCLACHARGLFHRPLYPLPRPDELPDDMTPDEFRVTVAFVYGQTFDFLCRTLLRREGAYIRRLLLVHEAPANRLAPQGPRDIHIYKRKPDRGRRNRIVSDATHMSKFAAPVGTSDAVPSTRDIVQHHLRLEHRLPNNPPKEGR